MTVSRKNKHNLVTKAGWIHLYIASFQAYKELGLLMLLVGVAVLTFSSLVYFAEKDNPGGAWSFLDSFW